MEHGAYGTVGVYLDANCPALLVVTHEETRVTREIIDLIQWMDKDTNRPTQVATWSITRGITEYDNKGNAIRASPPEGGISPPAELLAAITREAASEHDAPESDCSRRVWIAYDLMHFLEKGPGYKNARMLKDAAFTITSAGSAHTLIILDSQTAIPPRLEKVITQVEWPLPTREQIEHQVDELFPEMRSDIMADDGDEAWHALRRSVGTAALGLTASEIENILAQSNVLSGTLDTSVILRGKRDIIRARGHLEYYEPDGGLERVGGANALKEWLHEREKAFSPQAREFGLVFPRGLMLVGFPGCGKSRMAKSVAAAFGMPCLRLDIGAMMGRYVGQSEEQMRAALRLGDAMSPCVMWIDECEKAVPGGGSGGDGGTSSRVLSTLLTYMQERKSAVFIVMTANDVRSLPPELYRRGRLDEIFFIDFPSKKEREEIFAIHIRLRNRNPEDFDIAGHAAMAEHFTGSEIECVVMDGLYRAFFADRELTDADITHCIGKATRTHDTMGAKVGELRTWAEERARPATIPEVAVTETKASGPRAPGRRMARTRTRAPRVGRGKK